MSIDHVDKGGLSDGRTGDGHLVRDGHENCAAIGIGPVLDPIPNVIAAFNRLFTSTELDIAIIPPYLCRLVDC